MRIPVPGNKLPSGFACRFGSVITGQAHNVRHGGSGSEAPVSFVRNLTNTTPTASGASESPRR